MQKSFERFIGWARSYKPAPIPTLEDAVNDEHAPRRLESLMKHGLQVQASDYITLAMPMRTFNIVATMIGPNEPVRCFTAIDFTNPHSSDENGKPHHDRYIMVMNNREIAVAHQRQCITVMTPHPEDETYLYPKPSFMEMSRLTGVIDKGIAYVALRALASEYGALAVTPATPKDLQHYRQLQYLAELHKREPLSAAPPALP